MDVTNRLNIKVGLKFNESEALADLKKQLSSVEGKLKDFQKEIKPAQIKNMDTAVQSTNKSLSKMGNLFDQVTAKVKKNIPNFLAFTLVSGVFLSVTTQIKRTVELMIELDTAFTNFRIVTNATADEVAQVNARVDELTTSLGKLKKEVINAVTEFSRAGFSISESLTLAENAIKGANVGATDLSKVTTFLIAGLKSFNLEAEDSARILDVLFRVANTTAINLEGIGDAFLRSANTLKVAGATLEESASLIAAANESIQDPAKVGTALKTIASRLRGISEEGEIVPSLADDFKRIGVEIQNTDGSFRNIYDVFKDFADVYRDLDDLTKESILEKVAGKRQKNILIGLLENFDTAQSALEEALNSAGSVAEANEKYVDSLAGRINILTETWNKLTQTIVDSNLTKILITGLTAVIKAVTLIIENFDKLAFVVGSAGALTSIALFNSAIKGTALAIGGLTLAFNPLYFVVSALLGVFGAYQLATKNNVKSTDELTQATIALNKAQEENKKIINSGTEEQKREVNKRIKAILEEIDAINKKQLAEKLNASTIGEIAESTKKYEADLESLNNKLLEYGFNQEQARAYLNEYKQEVLSTLNPLEELANRYDAVNAEIKNTIDVNDLLFSSIQDLTDGQELSFETIQELLSIYPEYADVLGLSSDAQIDFLNTLIESNTKGLESEKAKNQQLQFLAENRIAIIQAEMEALITRFNLEENLRNGGLPSLDFQSGAYAKSLNEEVKALQAKIKSLDISNKLVDVGLGLVKERNVLETKSTKDTNKALSEQERILRDINNEIEIYNIKIQNAEGKERIALLNKIIDAQKRLKKELNDQLYIENERLKLMKDTDDKYDEQIDKVQDLYTALENANNAIYDNTKAISDQTKAIKEQEKEVRDSKISKLRDELSTQIKKNLEIAKKSIDTEIDKNKDLLDSLSDEYDARKKSFDLQNKQYEFNKKLAELNDDITANEKESQMLSIDTSLEANRRRAELAEELVDINKSKDDLIYDYNLQIQQDAIDDAYDMQKMAIEKQIELQESALYSIESSTNELLENISQASELELESLQNVFYDYINKSSDILADNLGGTWDTILSKVKEYNSLISNTSSGIQESATKGISLAKKDQSYYFGKSSADKAIQNSINQLDNSNLSDSQRENILNWLNNYTSELSNSLIGYNPQGMTVPVMKTPQLQSQQIRNNTGAIIHIENQNNNLSSNVDAENVGMRMAGKAKTVLNSGGYNF